MGFFDGYRASLKPRDVEEPVDYWVHRPLAYLFARVLYPTPISPNLVTVFSIVAGLAAAACLVREFPWHLQIAGGLIFLSAVLDCADGQLARMRKTSSAFGRMLDGCADLIVTLAVAPATVFVIWRKYATPSWLGLTVVGLCVVTMVTSSFHTGMYDHYKNVWLRFTSPGFKEGEDYETARGRWVEAAPKGLFSRLAWQVYLFYVKSQEDYVHGFDPHTVAAIGRLPPHTAENEAIYRARAGRPWTLLRRWLGFGSLMFGLATFNALQIPEVYLVIRLVLLNGLFFLVVRPMQREASRLALAEIAARDAGSPAE
jgi:hypothetical protein